MSGWYGIFIRLIRQYVITLLRKEIPDSRFYLNLAFLRLFRFSNEILQIVGYRTNLSTIIFFVLIEPLRMLCLDK